MADIEDLKNMTTVARNLIQARAQYIAAPDWIPEVRDRMDNIIKEKLESGFLAADVAVSGYMDAAASLAILEFHALRRELMNFYAAEAAIAEASPNGVFEETPQNVTNVTNIEAGAPDARNDS